MEIRTGSVHLQWKGEAPATPIQVKFTIAPESMRHPVGSLNRDCETSWDTSEPLDLDGIPLSIKELLVGGRVLPIDLEARDEERIIVDFAQLARRKR